MSHNSQRILMVIFAVAAFFAFVYLTEDLQIKGRPGAIIEAQK